MVLALPGAEEEDADAASGSTNDGYAATAFGAGFSTHEWTGPTPDEGAVTEEFLNEAFSSGDTDRPDSLTNPGQSGGSQSGAFLNTQALGILAALAVLYVATRGGA